MGAGRREARPRGPARDPGDPSGAVEAFHESYPGFDVERWDRPAYAGVRFRDPDGWIVEAFWEPPA